MTRCNTRNSRRRSFRAFSSRVEIGRVSGRKLARGSRRLRLQQRTDSSSSQNVSIIASEKTHGVFLSAVSTFCLYVVERSAQLVFHIDVFFLLTGGDYEN